MTQIAEPTGKLGVLIPGLGAVGTTFIAGVLNIRRGYGSAHRQPDANGDNPARQTD
jgi:hypothetical protein